ncbi:MAG: hypothetical protein KatS3mg103_1139 [Phycisphaerales bacterium]|nr:MAG: hypothetical protein KatS3mg103_1139 [Phycisphaerales bacterium]
MTSRTSLWITSRSATRFSIICRSVGVPSSSLMWVCSRQRASVGKGGGFLGADALGQGVQVFRPALVHGLELGVQLEELPAADVPVVVLELVAEDLRVGQQAVESRDDLRVDLRSRAFAHAAGLLCRGVQVVPACCERPACRFDACCRWNAGSRPLGEPAAGPALCPGCILASRGPPSPRRPGCGRAFSMDARAQAAVVGLIDRSKRGRGRGWSGWDGSGRGAGSFGEDAGPSWPTAGVRGAGIVPRSADGPVGPQVAQRDGQHQQRPGQPVGRRHGHVHPSADRPQGKGPGPDPPAS